MTVEKLYLKALEKDLKEIKERNLSISKIPKNEILAVIHSLTFRKS
jgi:hypothetical protein